MKCVCAILVNVLIISSLFGQVEDSTAYKTPKAVTEVIKELSGDTIVFFYDNQYQMVKPFCAKKFRVTKLDATSMFTGPFVDYFMDSIKAVEGTYLNGKKEGLFKLYFHNGQLEQTGNYLSDKKNGKWEYYYENGNKKQILEFKNEEILVQDFWDENGFHLVDAGNGDWYGYEDSDKFYKIRGTVLNGNKTGKWKREIPSKNIISNLEKYENGKFIKGSLNSLYQSSVTYKDNMVCIVEQPLALLKAEQFKISQCFRKAPPREIEYATYPGGKDMLFREIKRKMVFSSNNGSVATIRVKVTIDSTGKMTNFRPISNTGYEDDMINALRKMGNWFPEKVNGIPTSSTRLIELDLQL